MDDHIDTNEWRNNSFKGLVCGIMLCRNSPIKQCSKCSLHYCFFDLISFLNHFTPNNIALGIIV